MNRDEQGFFVSFPPHIVAKGSVSTLIHHNWIALIPAIGAALYFYRWDGLRVMAVAVAVAVVMDAGMQKFLKRDVTIADGSAGLTGLLLAFLLPPSTPLWVVTVGSIIAIILGKQLYGGLGNNPFHSTLVGWIVLRISWPEKVNLWIEPFGGDLPYPPLVVLKIDGVQAFRDFYFSFGDLFFGSQAGGIGVTCIAALIAGGLYLLVRRFISWHIPVGLLGMVMLFAAVLWVFDGETHIHPLYHVLSGATVLGALFIATDPVTSPLTRWGKLAYGILCGALIMVIRTWGQYPDGVAFGILLANAVTPLLNKIKPKSYGKE